MKIAFLTPEYPHPKTGNSGGIGTSIKNLAAGTFGARMFCSGFGLWTKRRSVF